MRINCLILSICVSVCGLLLQAGCAPKQIEKPVIRQEPAPKPQPRITFEKTSHDFGEIATNQKAKCKFKFTNTGTGELNISVRSICGCTAVVLKKRKYQPDESGEIEVTFRGQGSAGKIAKSVPVKTNDSKKRNINLKIKAKVVSMVAVKPRRMKLHAKKENAALVPIHLKSKDGNAFAIKTLTATNRAITVDFDPDTTATEFELHPKVADMAKLQKNRNGSIRIGLTHPRCKFVKIGYTIPPKFEAQPRTVFLGKARPNTKQTKEVVIKSNYGEQIDIQSISSRQGRIKVLSQEPVGETVKLKLEISLPERKPKQRYFTDSLQVKLAGDEQVNIACRANWPLQRRTPRRPPKKVQKKS